MVDGCRPGDGVNKRRASSEEGGVVINDGNEEEGVVGIEGRGGQDVRKATATEDREQGGRGCKRGGNVQQSNSGRDAVNRWCW